MQDDETDPIYMEALEWFVRMKEEHASERDRLDFETWLAARPSHRIAYDRARTLWDRFDVVKPEFERQQPGAIGRRGALLGGLAVLIAAPAAYLYTRADLFADFRTDIAERRSFPLPDGSSVELGGYSALSMQYSGGERHLILHRGQAFFQVAADINRPFIVQAKKGRIRALGTEFDVKIMSDIVTVSVIEHAVAVQTPGANDVVVQSGWQLDYGADGIRPLTQADAATVQAWRRDRIVFEDVPLRRVLAELERYRRGRIILMDQSIGDVPVTAIFDTRHTETALQTIADTLPLRILNANGYVTAIYRR
ncbi:FecR family protein [Agrobacterium sp. V1]|uniref:FecR family protein n=1 Tax=Agrobacterium sp. V1 TaxID=3061957 RepID=UPI0026729949|nr:FecR family protein [Agrobacterium sp. V1]MDO3445469.1 FecR family protein [Agrobacterium sp. V1]